MAARSLLPAFILALSAACWAPVARGAEAPPRAKEPPGAGTIQRRLMPVPLPIPDAIRPVTPVAPVAIVRWDELLDLKLVAGRIEVRTPEPPASIAGYLRNGRSITIQIEGTPAPSLWTINALRRNLAGGRLEWMARCAPSDAAAAQNQLTGSLRPVSVVIISGRLMITGRGQVDEKSVSVQYREDARGCQLVVLDGRNRVAGGAVGAGLAFGARAPNANARVALTDNSVGHMRSAHPAEVRTYLQPRIAPTTFSCATALKMRTAKSARRRWRRCEAQRASRSPLTWIPPSKTAPPPRRASSIPSRPPRRPRPDGEIDLRSRRRGRYHFFDFTRS